MQCGMWLWNHGSEFTKWQDPAMWYVALGWHAVEFARWQHLACNVAGNSGMTCHVIRPNVRHYWNSTSGFDFDHVTAVDMSFCTSLRNFVQIGHPQQTKMTSCRFSRWRISAILDFRGPIMDSLNSPCRTSYRSSTETMALNCLVLIAFLYFGERQTNRQTDRQVLKISSAGVHTGAQRRARERNVLWK